MPLFSWLVVKEECEIGLKQYQTDSNLCDLDTTLVRQAELGQIPNNQINIQIKYNILST